MNNPNPMEPNMNTYRVRFTNVDGLDAHIDVTARNAEHARAVAEETADETIAIYDVEPI